MVCQGFFGITGRTIFNNNNGTATVTTTSKCAKHFFRFFLRFVKDRRRWGEDRSVGVMAAGKKKKSDCVHSNAHPRNNDISNNNILGIASLHLSFLNTKPCLILGSVESRETVTHTHTHMKQ